MYVRRLALACLFAATPACSVYTTRVQTERYVETERVAPENVSGAELPASEGVTIIRRNGVAVTFPDGARVTKVHGGIAVDAGPGQALETYANEDVATVEMRRNAERVVHHRVRDDAASNGLTVVGVVVGTAAVIFGGLAIAASNNTFGH